MIIEIKSITGKVLYSSEATSLRECLVNAVSDSAYLRGADLQGAYLQGADLRGAYLRGADLRGAYLWGADLQGAYLLGADLRGAYLRGADLRGAYLHGAYLRGADLQGADLRGAYLRGADLQGADLRENVKIKLTPIQIVTSIYDVTIFDSHIQIGCKFYSIAEWKNFDDEEISLLETRSNVDALAWWTKWKAPIMAICAAEGRQ